MNRFASALLIAALVLSVAGVGVIGYAAQVYLMSAAVCP